MSEKLKKFLDEEKEFFLKNHKLLNKVNNEKKRLYFIIGEGGHMDIILKIIFSICITIFMTKLYFMLFSNIDLFSEESMLNFDFLNYPNMFISVILVYMILSITNKKGILLGAYQDFLQTKVDEEKIKKISKHLPNEIIENQKKMIDIYGSINLKYKDLEDAIKNMQKENKKNELFGRDKI